MLAIKLQRVGKKHQPSYRLVVAEKRSKMAAPPVEDLGAYNPFTKATTFNGERVAYWLGVGARPTLTVHNLLVAQGLLSAPKRAVKMKRKAAAPAPAAAAESETKTETVTVAAATAAPSTEAPAVETAPAEVPSESIDK
jgi:small subunit ribosomal protein S16